MWGVGATLMLWFLEKIVMRVSRLWELCIHRAGLQSPLALKPAPRAADGFWHCCHQNAGWKQTEGHRGPWREWHTQGLKTGRENRFENRWKPNRLRHRNEERKVGLIWFHSPWSSHFLLFKTSSTLPVNSSIWHVKSLVFLMSHIMQFMSSLSWTVCVWVLIQYIYVFSLSFLWCTSTSICSLHYSFWADCCHLAVRGH